MKAPNQLTAGTTVGGDFRVVRPLSAGGMGAVYVADQVSTGKRRALKVMHPELVEEAKSRERFVQEARVGALIDSDHVVEVIGAGVEEDTGLPWLAMELLEGKELADYVAKRGRLEPQLVGELLRQLCHAISAAHQAGVVHRDIKPENIFVVRSRSATTPTTIKMLDFGIAKVAASGKTTATARVGSPAWMAPEQTDPRARIAPATDVWAVGLVAFWLLTGRMFWKLANDEQASLQALMREILLEPIPRASVRAAELGVGQRWSELFDGWFACCVAREPEDRFEDASELYDGFKLALGDWLGDDEPPSEGRNISHGDTVPLDALDEQSGPVRVRSGRALDSEREISLPPPSVQASLSEELPASVGKTPAPQSEAAATTGAPDDAKPEARLRWLSIAAIVATTLATVVAWFAIDRSPLRLVVEGYIPEPQPLLVMSAESSAPVADTALVPSGAPLPSARPTASTVAVPTPPTARGKAGGSAKRQPEFPAQRAQHTMQIRATGARLACATYATVPTVSVTVAWFNSGAPSKVVVSGALRTGRLKGCVEGVFRAARIPSFDGPSQTLGATVTFVRR